MSRETLDERGVGPTLVADNFTKANANFTELYGAVFVGGLSAGEDLSSKQYHIVTVSGDNEVSASTVSGGFGFGVVQNAPEIGESVDVITDGVTLLEVGTEVEAGDFFGSDANGKARPINAAVDGDLEEWVLGTVLVGATAGNQSRVKFGSPLYFVTV